MCEHTFVSIADSERHIRTWSITDPDAYAYLLGCYLGDGYIVHKPPNGWGLRICCDRQYPGIEREVVESMKAVFPDATPHLTQKNASASDEVRVNHPAMPMAFPQHGPGNKHLRGIGLETWQLAITLRRPEALIRGLIHSDGCRTVNEFDTRLPSGRTGHSRYVRYFFSNLSLDIQEIFREHCELLGLRVTQSNHRNLSVSHRKGVAVLEELVGPKY
jgi:hypothetical protein